MSKKIYGNLDVYGRVSIGQNISASGYALPSSIGVEGSVISVVDGEVVFSTISELSGGEYYYQNVELVPTTLGGVVAGTSFPTPTPLRDVIDMLLYPYQTPSFSSFSISGQNTSLEVGDTIGTNKTFIWNTSNPSNIQTNSISILDITNPTTIAGGLSNTGTYTSTYPTSPIQKISISSHTFQIKATNTHSSDFTSNFVVNWKGRIYYGQSTNSGPLNQTQIKALTSSSLATSLNGTYNFGTSGYKYFTYPSSLGTATSFKDQSTNLDVAMETAYTVSVTNSFGVTMSYNVHRTTNQLGSSINIIIS